MGEAQSSPRVWPWLADHPSEFLLYRGQQRQQARQGTADAPWFHAQQIQQRPAATVLLSVDGCSLGMQVRARRRRRTDAERLPPLPVMEEGHSREVKTGVLLLPEERVETSPGRRSVVRRFLVSCLGDADVPRIRYDETAALVQLPERGAHV